MIDAKELETVFTSCLFYDDEPLENMVEVDGILNPYGFHPERLETSRKQVEEWLAQLPDSFHKSGGGGMSFLKACETRDGERWGEHRSMDMLFCLGMGLGLVFCPIPRNLWSVLPGKVPYYVIDLDN